jgi:hypothetical protein
VQILGRRRALTNSAAFRQDLPSYRIDGDLDVGGGSRTHGDATSRSATSCGSAEFLHPTPYPHSLLWIDATDDAHVRAAEPDANFGADPTLLSAGGDDAATVFMRFDLSGLERPARYVKLSLRTAEEHRPPATSAVFLVDDDDWTESTLVFTNAPSPGRSLGWIPHAGRDSTMSLDVTSTVNAHDDDILTLAIAPVGTQDGPALVVSREGGHAPRLVVVP